MQDCVPECVHTGVRYGLEGHAGMKVHVQADVRCACTNEVCAQRCERVFVCIPSGPRGRAVHPGHLHTGVMCMHTDVIGRYRTARRHAGCVLT